jgi:hypothetical protein
MPQRKSLIQRALRCPQTRLGRGFRGRVDFCYPKKRRRNAGSPALFARRQRNPPQSFLEHIELLLFFRIIDHFVFRLNRLNV